MSTSEQALAYLKELQSDGRSDVFTSKMICDYIPQVNQGAVTGFISHMQAKDIIKQVGRDGKYVTYQITGDLDDYKTRGKPGKGGKIGRSLVGTTRKERLTNTLFALVEEVEKMKGDLADFSTQELLQEIGRRTK